MDSVLESSVDRSIKINTTTVTRPSARFLRKEMFYLTMHSTHFIYGYMASDIWLRTILIVRKETRCHHMGYSYRLTARVLLYAPSHRQDNTYHGLCYTSRGSTGWNEKYLNGSTLWRIDPTTHRTMSERSYHGATSRSSQVFKCMKINNNNLQSVIQFIIHKIL